MSALESKRQLVLKIIENTKNGKLKWTREIDRRRGFIRIEAPLEIEDASVEIIYSWGFIHLFDSVQMSVNIKQEKMELKGSVAYRSIKRILLDLSKEEKKFYVDFIENQLPYIEVQKDADLIKSLL